MISSSCAKFWSGFSGLLSAVAELRGRNRPDGRQTFLNQIPLSLPVIERRKQKSVRLITMHNFFGGHRFRPRIVCGLSRLPSGFCSSPPSASRSCTPCHHFFVICPFPVIRITIRERPSKTPSASPRYFNSNRAAKVSRESQRRCCCGRGRCAFGSELLN
jgi:hypothetical protein